MTNAVFGFCEGIDAAVILLFLSRTLHASAIYIGLVYSAAAVGSVLGALTVTRIVARLGTRRTLIAGIGVGSPLLIVTVLAQPGWSTSIVAIFSLPAWFGLTIYNIVQYGHRQAVCPEQMRGRMNATMQVINNALIPAGAIVGAGLADLIGFRLTLLVTALGLSTSFIWLLALPADELPLVDDASLTGPG